MDWLRPLGSSGLLVSAIGLGAVKFGRNTDVKYAQPFDLPDDRSAAYLLARASELGINLIDTAPAYGSSEERLGKLLSGQRDQWLLATKVGEEYTDGQSRFDYSARHTRHSVERSLRRLRTDVIDIVSVHSCGDDLDIIEHTDVLEQLHRLKEKGSIRAFGISTKTTAGGLAAAGICDVQMLTYNLSDQSQRPVIEACARTGCGVLIKKPFASGHLAAQSPVISKGAEDSLELVLKQPGTGAAVIGTVNTNHLESNVGVARSVLAANSPLKS
ncbi:MAG: aldo/keto reductase [Pseudomonadota bacterium]